MKSQLETEDISKLLCSEASEDPRWRFVESVGSSLGC